MTDIDIKAKDVTTENNGENCGAMVSVNTGTITVVNGMQYMEVCALCKDLIADEIARYRETALEEAKRRDERLLSTFAKKLAEEHLAEKKVQEAFETPEMQIDYQDAQKAFIKAGTPELEEILTSILVRRVQESGRTLLQITLSEAIKTASILLPCQMAALALRFILVHTKRTNIVDEISFIHYCTQTIIPIQKNASWRESEFQHLSFTGCGQISIGSISIETIFSRIYKGLFSKGLSEAEIPKDASDISFKDKYSSMFIRCITDRSKWQIGVMDEHILKEHFKKYGVETADQPQFLDLFNRQHMSPDEIREQIVKWLPEMTEVFRYWENCGIKSLILSSVGIVIGAFYAQSTTQEKYDLNNWI